MIEYLKIENFDIKNKIVGIRIDINSPIIDNQIVDNERIKAHSKTLKYLSEQGAKVIVFAHQGRLGKPDCISLKNHIPLIEKVVKKKIFFQENLDLNEVKTKIKDLKDGDILLLENLRFYSDEMNPTKKPNKIKQLGSLLDYYVLDAFSIAHRSQTSIIGINGIPTIAGKVMEEELLGLNRIKELKRPTTYILGGAKPDDLINIIKKNIKQIDYVILTGVIGELGLIAQGYNLGKKETFIKEKGYISALSEVKKLLSKYKEKIVLPVDLAIKIKNRRKEFSLTELKQIKEIKTSLILDIGAKSIQNIKKIIAVSETIYLKGPAGNFEDKLFEKGTKQIIKSLENSKAFRFLGGGHTVTAIEQYSRKEKFSYISLAGGALVKFLSNEKLPGLEVLEKSFKKYGDENEKEYLVLGSNVVDTYLECPEYLNQIRIGDKITTKERFKEGIGGGGINVSICLKRLGANVKYLGKFSNETFEKILSLLNREKIQHLETKVTKKAGARSIVIDTKDKDRIIFCYRGQNHNLKITDLNIKEVQKFKYVYLTSLVGESFKTMTKIVQIIKKRNKDSKVCINLSMNLIDDKTNLDNLIKYTDIVVLNYEEAQAYTGKESITECLKNIVKKSKIAIITDGAHGVYGYDGSKEYYVKAIKPKRVVDTTGAGDSFGGTFFYFYTKNFGIERSMNLAVKNASSVVANKGAQLGLLYYSDLVLK